jgi:hypothetical protein
VLDTPRLEEWTDNTGVLDEVVVKNESDIPNLEVWVDDNEEALGVVSVVEELDSLELEA